jgi:hypothetical protein
MWEGDVRRSVWSVTEDEALVVRQAAGRRNATDAAAIARTHVTGDRGQSTHR